MLKLAVVVLLFGASTSWAAAADFTMPSRIVADAPLFAPAAALHAWDGAYAGAHAGFAAASAGGPTISSFDFSGTLIGGQIGYNFMPRGAVFGPENQLVIGLEGDLDWRNQLGNSGTLGFLDGDILSWSGALTGHVGLARDRLMGYLLTGVAFAHNEFFFQSIAPVRPTVIDTETHVGVTIGAGAAMMIADNISLFAEYRYADYGRADYTNAPALRLTDNAIRIGANFYF